MESQLHKHHASFDVSFPHQKRIWGIRRFHIDGVIDPQLPQPCPRRNTATSVSSSRRHSSSLLPPLFSLTPTNGTCQQENGWDPTRLMYVGGRDPLLRLSFRPLHTYVYPDSPEIGPGEMTNDSSSTTTSASPSPTAFSTVNSNSLISSQNSPSSLPAGGSSPPGGSSSNAATIVGGDLGGINIIILIMIVALGIYFYLRRKRRNAASPGSSADAALAPDGPRSCIGQFVAGTHRSRRRGSIVI